MSLASELFQGLVGGDRRALSKAISLVESSLPSDRLAARELLALLGAPSNSSFRVGITGVPGAGKSTLLDALGLQAIAAGRRVAVLAIDPSSRQSGGSVLGDKTRMTRLSVEQAAFVRPSPTLGVLGGTAGRTREAILLCEAAGYDLIFVETVGVGQSEELVAGMVDCVLLVLLAGAGDELSSMKRGVLEAADLILFNKADRDRLLAVEAEAASLRSSLSISRGQRVPEVLVSSALEGTGIAELWAALAARYTAGLDEGALVARRISQRSAWFDAALDEELRAVFTTRPELLSARTSAQASVEQSLVSPLEAAQRLVASLFPTSPS